jgi:hypothetical protein
MGNCCYGQNHHIDLDSQVISPPISNHDTNTIVSNDDTNASNVSNISNILNISNASNASNVSNTSFDDDDDVVDFDKIIEDYQKSHPRPLPRHISEPPITTLKRQNHITFYEKEHNKPLII